MKRNDFQSRFDEFISYLTFFGFVGLVGFGGYWFYRIKILPAQTAASAPATPSPDASPAPPATAIGKPTDFLKPLMEANLPPLFEPFSHDKIQLSANFSQVATTMDRTSRNPGPWQPAWVLGRYLCQEIRAGYDLRNKMVDNFNPPTSILGIGTSKESTLDRSERQKREGFFEQVTAKNWSDSARQIHSRIDALYRQLLAAEAKAAVFPNAKP